MTDIPLMRNGPQFDEEEIRREVKRFKALGDETRLKMIRLLETGEHCVCEIMEAFHIGQSTASHHLKILENTGLILARREGKFVYYRIITRSLDEHGNDLPSLLFDTTKSSGRGR